ncbi:MAG: radical SAM/SPASM domain-containing protein [Pedobacter sp.]
MEYHRPPYFLRELKLEVTHDCRLDCIHCSSMAQRITHREIPLERCKEILREASTLGVVDVAFSGGEPLLWQGLTDVVSLSSHLGMNVSLYTTGNVDSNELIFSSLKSAGLGRVMFSLFGENAKLHETVTRVKGSYEVTLAAIKKCIDFDFEVELHFVPLSDNYLSLRKIAELGKVLGVSRLSVLRLVPQGRCELNGVKALTKSQNLDLRRLIIGLRDQGYEIRTGSPFNALMLREKPQCCSGIDRLTVSPDLKISPCDAFKQVSCQSLGVGDEYSSLNGNTLTECWEKSPYLQLIRNYLTTPFANICAVCPSLENCLSGCVAQKFHAYGNLAKCPDPMCLM